MKRTLALLIMLALAPTGWAEEHKDGWHFWDWDHHREHHDDGERASSIPVVPEANPAWVLLPIVGAILLWHYRGQRKKTI